mgnify:CR=1 FL=1|jgi:hypothetical protein
MKNLNLFTGLDYKKYNDEHKIHDIVGVTLEEYGEIEQKLKRPTYYSVDPTNEESYTPELDDLIRLHFLVTSRKVTTALEFGIGKSSLVLADALSKNKKLYSDVVSNFRRSNPFELHSVENNIGWIEFTKKSGKDKPDEIKKIQNFHYCPLEISDFNGRMCTYYHNIPNLSPDFIYLDGPDQYSAGGSLRGLGTNHPDRMPMAADILTFEHFLCPGTLIVLDGRTANARFLKCNLQRNWLYAHDKDLDQHFFELVEEPLGIYNSEYLEFALGSNWYKNKTKK